MPGNFYSHTEPIPFRIAEVFAWSGRGHILLMLLLVNHFWDV